MNTARCYICRSPIQSGRCSLCSSSSVPESDSRAAWLVIALDILVIGGACFSLGLGLPLWWPR